MSLTKYPELNPHMYGYLRGLKRLYVYAMRFGFQITAVVTAVVIAAARPLVGIYTTDADVLNLAVFSIRWMAAGLVFDTVSALLQHYLQGIRSLKLLNALCLGERFAVPVATAFVLGRFYGTKGILASAGMLPARISGSSSPKAGSASACGTSATSSTPPPFTSCTCQTVHRSTSASAW